MKYRGPVNSVSLNKERSSDAIGIIDRHAFKNNLSGVQATEDIVLRFGIRMELIAAAVRRTASHNVKEQSQHNRRPESLVGKRA